MKKLLVSIFLLVCVATAYTQDVNPMDLEFQRLSVRRFIFSNNIGLTEFKPSEIVAFASMHPAFAVADDNIAVCDTSFSPRINEGKLILDASSGKMPVCFYVGSVNPYATYDLDIESIIASSGETVDIGIDLARRGLRDRVQVIARSGKETGIVLRVYQDTKLVREESFAAVTPKFPYKLRVQLYGRSLGVFTEKDGVTTYHGHLDGSDTGHFGNVLDFRNLDINRQCSFNIFFNKEGKVILNGASSYLSAGVGQADIRAVSYEDLTPFMDEGRLWFMFSCRGIGLPHPGQGVMSLDPSTFEVRFEGMIVFDFGDGLLRNTVGTHLFYDRNAKEWRAYSCDFGGSAYREGRSESQLFTATANKDPRRGYSVMKAQLISNDYIAGKHEDPCIFFDKEVQKWRLLTSSFQKGQIVASMFESDKWNGKFTEITPAIDLNSTGTCIQKIGKNYYCFMGGTGNLRIHSYPDLKYISDIRMDYQPHWPKPALRVWANVVPLPAGYPYRYVLLTMDRANFPGITKQTWSYGSLYFYGANPKDISSDEYEFGL